MFNLFALLFKASYWRMMVRGDTWTGAWQNLRRAHKDRRARKQLRNLAWLCLAPFVCFAYATWVLRGAPLLVIPVLIPIFWWQWWRGKKRAAEQRAALAASHRHRELTDEDRPQFRQYFADVALIYAVMLDRAGSERFLHNKILPEGVEITTRRVHLDLLKSKGVWDKMSQRDREALIIPDGEWNHEWFVDIVIGFEPLRLLRWILSVDTYLPVIGRQMRFDYKLANEIVRAPERLLAGKELVSSAMMERGRKAAEHFYNRCVAERIHRGYAEGMDADSKEIATKIAKKYSGKQHEDLVLGVKLVSEASRGELDWATMLSRRRAAFLHWTLAAIDQGSVPEPPYEFHP